MGCIANGFSVAISDRLWYLFYPRTCCRPGREVFSISWGAEALVATSAYVSFCCEEAVAIVVSL